MSPEEMAAKKAELLAKREERAKAALALQEAHELLVLELEDRFTNELGARGAAFDIVNEDNTCDEGPIVVKLGEAVKHKAWVTKGASTSPEDQTAYVVDAVVYPDRAKFLDIAGRRPELLGRVAAAATALYGFSVEVLRGKR